MCLKWRHSSPICHYAVNFIWRRRSRKFKAWSQGKKALELTCLAQRAWEHHPRENWTLHLKIVWEELPWDIIYGGLTISALHPHLSNLHPLLFRDILRNRYIESSITTLRTRLLKRKIGQRMINNLIRNSTQTAVTNMTIKRMLENKII